MVTLVDNDLDQESRQVKTDLCRKNLVIKYDQQSKPENL